jgi:8-oxo-dGTP diphosphatase
MTATSTSIRVLAAVICVDSRYLICQRPAHKRHGGLWEFPGGKVERGETDLEAARRELREELGVAAIDVGPVLFSVHDPGSLFLIAFVQVGIEGDPQCHEHTAFRWLPMLDLAALPLAPADRRFVEYVLARTA